MLPSALRSTPIAAIFLLAGLAGGAACTGSSNSTPQTDRPDADSTSPDSSRSDASPDGHSEGPTYHADVAPIIEQNCGGCHDPGGIGSFPLTSYDKLTTYSDQVVNAVEAGRMPPWPPDRSCRRYQHERIMPEKQKQTLLDWVSAGMPKGDPSNAPEQTSGGSQRPDRKPDIVTGTSGPYTPREDVSDDYHCFLLDKKFKKDTFMVGSDLRPDDPELVHHANIFLVKEHQTAKPKRLEKKHDEPGYPCFGTPGFQSITLVGAWVPGSTPVFTPEDSAIVIPEGSRLVLQTHFNTLFSDTNPVDPEFLMYTRDKPPEKEVNPMPFAKSDISIPAGNPHDVESKTFTNYGDEPWNVIGVAPHMHLLGKSFSAKVIRSGDNRQDQCLIDIPDWDFDWQQAYRFRKGKSVKVYPGDKVKMSCVYDNSASNQPVIDGERREPKRVTWGGGSTDEMCINFLMTLEDYTPTKETEKLCKPFQTCRNKRDYCKKDPFGLQCLFNCATVDLSCGLCLFNQTQACAKQYCQSELNAAKGCLFHCGQAAQAGGDINACLEKRCPKERDALEKCLSPHVKKGHCNPQLDKCEVSF